MIPFVSTRNKTRLNVQMFCSEIVCRTGACAPYVYGWRRTILLERPLNHTTTKEVPSRLCASRHPTVRCVYLGLVAHNSACFSLLPLVLHFASMKNTVYAYSDVWVCLYESFGCDTQGQEEEYLESSTMTEGGNPSAVFIPGGEHEQEWLKVDR